MDKLNDHMKTIEGVGEKFHPSILAAMKLARNKMDRYWKKTDESNVYHIAMGQSFRVTLADVTINNVATHSFPRQYFIQA